TANSNLFFSGVVNLSSTFLTVTGAGNVTFTGSVLTGGALNMNGTGSVVLDPNANNTAIINANSGTTILIGNPVVSAAATLNINGGTVKSGTNSGFQVSALVTMNGGTLDVNGNNGSIGRITGFAGTVTNNGVATATLTILENGSTTFGGTIADGIGQ